MILAVIRIVLPRIEGSIDTFDQSRSDRRRLAELDLAPDGARVVVDLRGRRCLCTGALADLHRLGQRMTVELQAEDVETVAQHVRAVRAGSWETHL